MPKPIPVKTFGLTHIALAVGDPQRSLRFYRAVLGAQPVFESKDFVQAQTPGSRDVLVFERRRARAGRPGGVIHFGFRLKRPADIAIAVRAAVAAGGVIVQQGEFIPGEPYVFSRTRTATKWRSGTSCPRRSTRAVHARRRRRADD